MDLFQSGTSSASRLLVATEQRIGRAGVHLTSHQCQRTPRMRRTEVARHNPTDKNWRRHDRATLGRRRQTNTKLINTRDQRPLIIPGGRAYGSLLVARGVFKTMHQLISPEATRSPWSEVSVLSTERIPRKPISSREGTPTGLIHGPQTLCTLRFILKPDEAHMIGDRDPRADADDLRASPSICAGSMLTSGSAFAAQIDRYRATPAAVGVPIGWD